MFSMPEYRVCRDRTLVMGLGPNQEVPLEIGGVARDAQVGTVGQIGSSYMYLPAGSGAQRRLRLLVRGESDAAAPARLQRWRLRSPVPLDSPRPPRPARMPTGPSTGLDLQSRGDEGT
jgi:hypothetical protein